MRAVWACASVFALVIPAAAQEQAPEGNVRAENVDTWTITTVDGNEFEVRPATPSYRGDTGLFHLSSAYTLPKGKVSVSGFRDNLDRDPKDIDWSIHGLTIAWGAKDNLELFGSFGIQHRVRTKAFTQVGFFNDLPFAGTGDPQSWQTGFGDIWLGGKYKLKDDYRGDGVGLAIKAEFKLPSADEDLGLGTGKFSGGASLILSKTLNFGADIHASVGFEGNASPDGNFTIVDPTDDLVAVGEIGLGNAFTWGFGINVPALKIFQLQAEIYGKSYSGASFDQTNPIDVIIGPVIYIRPGLFIRPAVSFNLNFDDRGLGDTSSAGKQISIGYHPGTLAREIWSPPPPPPPPENKPPTVAVDCKPESVLPGETSKCHAAASDPDGDPLTYKWTASAGRVSGSGADVTFDSTGVNPGTTANVSVEVSDGRGGTARGSDGVRVDKPAPPPEPIPCTSGGFPGNASRLNNVDKACLDGVASRLRQDPRSRVMIVGHADSGERNPDVISRKRAEEIKAYLVGERGVDESRISVRGVGATHPLDAGTSRAARAKNRRVDLLFLPEGATAPDHN